MKALLLALSAIVVWSLPVSAQVMTPNQVITVVDSGTACVTAPAACATWALDSQTGGLTISVGGTWTGTLTFEGTNNDGVWTALLATNVATDARATTTTASGLFTVTNVGVIKVRVRATAAITGTALITAAKGQGFVRSWTTGGTITAGGAGGSFYAADGTSSLPAYSFTSEPTLGFWRSASGIITSTGAFKATSLTATTGSLFMTGGSGVQIGANALITFLADGNLSFRNAAGTIGSQLKVDALPTIASGFGTSPSITAGSTPLAGSVNVGTGGAATTGLITFGGTAFPSAPFCLATPSLTNVPTRATTVSTTQLTLTTSTAWTASDVISWICISSK